MVRVVVRVLLAGSCKPRIHPCRSLAFPPVWAVSQQPQQLGCALMRLSLGPDDELGNWRKLIYPVTEVCVRIGKDGSSFDRKPHLRRLETRYSVPGMDRDGRRYPKALPTALGPSIGDIRHSCNKGSRLSFNVVWFAEVLPRVLAALELHVLDLLKCLFHEGIRP